MAMDKGANRKDDFMHLPTLSPEMMAIGPECPRESLEEEGGGERPRIADVTIRGRNGQKPWEPIPENPTIGPVCPCETEEKVDGFEESSHDASEEGWEMACEEVEDGAAAEKEKMRLNAEGSGIKSPPERGPNRVAF